MILSIYLVSADSNSRDASENGHNDVKASSPLKVSQVYVIRFSYFYISFGWFSVW